MLALLMVLASLVSLYFLFLAAIFIASLFLVRKMIREHQASEHYWT